MREILLALAAEAARDPSRAARIAEYIADICREADKSEGQIPLGYLYAGAHKLLAIAENLAIETLEPAEGGTPITTTANRPIQIRIPFDVLIIGVGGWAEPNWRGIAAGDGGVAFALPSQAPDYLDTFSTDFQLDGATSFTTDGDDRLMAPAAVTVGTQRRPRPMAWTLRRNQLIAVRFRNILNAFSSAGALGFQLRRVGLCFYALNLEAP